MQPFAIFLLIANLAVSALAAPIANTTSSSCVPSAPDFLCGTQVGEGTWFAPGEGACGFNNKSSQLIVAVSWKLYDNYPGYKGGNPNTNPVCGRKIHAKYKGKGVKVTVVDRCTGCNETDLDFSSGAFGHLADLSVGRLYNMTWTWAS